MLQSAPVVLGKLHKETVCPSAQPSCSSGVWSLIRWGVGGGTEGTPLSHRGGNPGVSPWVVALGVHGLASNKLRIKWISKQKCFCPKINVSNMWGPCEGTVLPSPFVLCVCLSSAHTATVSSPTHLPSHLLTLPPLGKYQGHSPTLNPENKPNEKTVWMAG